MICHKLVTGSANICHRFAKSCNMVFSISLVKRSWVFICLTCWFCFVSSTMTEAGETNSVTTTTDVPLSKAQLTGEYILPRISLSGFKTPPYSKADLELAKKNGLAFTDLPSIGSGLARRADGALFGITDRGPNSHLKFPQDPNKKRRVFPLPEFCPAIVQFELTHNKIHLDKVLPLTGSQGQPLTGLSNNTNEETCYASLNAPGPLPPDPSGVDTEGIRCLPGGGFVLCEEYAPSILVVSASGQVRMRYTPTSKPLIGAHYPVQPILPNIFCDRRLNRGFEGVALSSDGKTLYAILQSPMGNAHDPRYANSRVIRILEMDFSNPLHARVTGMFLLQASSYTDYPHNQRQDQVKVSELTWLAPKRLLVLERAKGRMRLFVADLARASNVLHRSDAETLRYEDGQTDLAALGIRPAKRFLVFDTAEIPAIDTDKLEGVALLAPDEIALANDNDFGIGENAVGEPSKVWTIRIPALARFER